MYKSIFNYKFAINQYFCTMLYFLRRFKFILFIVCGIFLSCSLDDTVPMICEEDIYTPLLETNSNIFDALVSEQGLYVYVVMGKESAMASMGITSVEYDSIIDMVNRSNSTVEEMREKYQGVIVERVFCDGREQSNNFYEPTYITNNESRSIPTGYIITSSSDWKRTEAPIYLSRDYNAFLCHCSANQPISLFQINTEFNNLSYLTEVWVTNGVNVVSNVIARVSANGTNGYIDFKADSPTGGYLGFAACAVAMN